MKKRSNRNEHHHKQKKYTSAVSGRDCGAYIRGWAAAPAARDSQDGAVWADESGGFTYEAETTYSYSGVKITDCTSKTPVIPKQLGGVDVVKIDLKNKGLTSIDLSAATQLRDLNLNDNNDGRMDSPIKSANDGLCAGMTEDMRLHVV